MTKIVQGLLLILFIYLTSMMIVMSNGSSFLGRYLSFFYIPVANSIGLNTTWNFFSPDPAHTMYLKYVIHFENEYGDPINDSIEKFFPDESQNSDFRMHVRRMSYVMRFLSMDQNRLREFFVPWVCRQYPDATRIQTMTLFYRIPTLDLVSTLSDSDYMDLVKEEQFNENIFSCVR
jgi:hypothetical protein